MQINAAKFGGTAYFDALFDEYGIYTTNPHQVATMRFYLSLHSLLCLYSHAYITYIFIIQPNKSKQRSVSVRCIRKRKKHQIKRHKNKRKKRMKPKVK